MFHFDLDYKGPIPDEIGVKYQSTFSQALIGHSAMVILHSNYRTGLDKNEASVSHIFSSGSETAHINLLGEKPWSVFGRFVKLGFWHILIGFDHVAFLLALLLPSILIARANIWHPADTVREAGWSIVKIATTFTVAHSITLSLAALGVFVPSVTIIESLIALSIVAAAALNIFAVRPALTLPIVFALGLLHGFGFSYVMEPLGVARQTLVQSLIGFNIGVELGQLSIITLVFPVLFILRRQRWYLPVILRGGSLLLIAVACYWFGARAIVLLQSLLQI